MFCTLVFATKDNGVFYIYLFKYNSMGYPYASIIFVITLRTEHECPSMCFIENMLPIIFAFPWNMIAKLAT